MSEVLRPGSEDEIAAIIADAAASRQPLEVAGQGGKAGIGRPPQVSSRLSCEGLSGITLYEPSELVISARAGTPLAEIEATLAENGQQLAFEPVDYGPLFGQEPGRGTIGAIFAGNISGPRRIQVGA
ncbi:MAG: FAD-binding protein, partial [Alphaproteobacteria bacterium]